MRTFLKVFAFNILIIAFFLYVGNSIPQLRQDPPKELVLAADAPVEDFVRAGQDIFYGKGTCALCHEIGKKGERCPDLAGVGERAETRLKEERYKGKATNGAEYLVESVMEPTAYVVEGYQPSMPPVGRQLTRRQHPQLPRPLRAARLGRSWCSSGAVSRVINSMARRSLSGLACGTLGRARMPIISGNLSCSRTP